MKIWFKIMKDNRLMRDLTVSDDSDDTRTHKIFRALEQCCLECNLPRPLWLDAAVREFQRYAKTRFRQDSFIEEIDFDYLEIHVIEED